MIVWPQLVMERWTGRAAGRADKANKLSPCNLIADLDVEFGHMAVTSYQAVAMIDLDHVAVTALPVCFCDRAGSRSVDQIAAFAVDVDPGMKFISSSAERVSTKTEFIIYLAQMRPNIRNIL